MLDLLKSIIESTRQTTIERLKSPFVGSFFFSWFGFNWDAVAIMLFSPKNIEVRIERVTSTHNIEQFIIGPLCVSFIICLLLPWVNRVFIWYQSKPIDQATSLSLTSKIITSRKQLTLSRLQAKKELAKKKEERNIEENISSILRRSNFIDDANDKLKSEVEDSQAKINDLLVDNEVMRTNLSSNQEAINQLRQENSELKSQNKELNKHNQKLQSSLIDSQKEITSITRENESLKKFSEDESKKSNDLHNQLNLLTHCFPNMFFKGDTNNNFQTNSEVVKKMIELNDSKWYYKDSQSSTQNKMRRDLSTIKEMTIEARNGNVY